MICRAMIISAAFTAMPAWAVNKCIGPNGAPIFQDQPCPGSGITVGEDIANKQAARDRVAQSQGEAARRQVGSSKTDIDKQAEETVAKLLQESNEKVAAAKAKCHTFDDMPKIGMSESQFLSCTYFGVVASPERINETETAGGITKQFVYRSGNLVRYLYTRNGVVSGIQR